MNCKYIRNMFSAYMDGELNTEQAQTVKLHLKTCDNCHQQFQEYKNSWKLLDLCSPIEPGSDYISRFWMRLASEVSWQERLGEAIKRILFPRRLVYKVVWTMVVLLLIHISISKYVYTLRVRTLLINMSEEEWEMIENYDLFSNLDFFEDLEKTSAVGTLG